MSAHANVRHANGVAIVDLSGKITLGEGCGLVRSTIKDLISAGNKDILINVQSVGYIDSAGLGELVGSYATVTNLGGRIKLLHVEGKVRDLLQVTKLYTVFVVFADEGEALRSFSSAASA